MESFVRFAMGPKFEDLGSEIQKSSKMDTSFWTREISLVEKLVSILDILQNRKWGGTFFVGIFQKKVRDQKCLE